MPFVDLNCDMGESHGTHIVGNDAAILPFVTSINVACGFHGGDDDVMRITIEAALEHGVRIGAHPGLPDLEGFGRREMSVSAHEVYEMTATQVTRLSAIAQAAGTRIEHVKPHGALYNMAARTADLADAIARAVYDVDPTLIFVGLSGSALIDAGQRAALQTASEVFADRNYLRDGSLVPRTQPNALLTDATVAAARAVEMVLTRSVRSIEGTTVGLSPDTICLHGDAPDAARFAQQISDALFAADITVRPIARRAL
jgi:5-oxoprolinase (ATP-hydrolysing) subunit A